MKINTISIRTLFVGVGSIFPLLASAQSASGGTGTSGNGTVSGIISNIISFINTGLVPLVFAIAFIVFLWGVFNYFIAGAGNDEKRKEGRTFIMYAIIGFVVMVSVWGIVNLLTNSLYLGPNTRPDLPKF